MRSAALPLLVSVMLAGCLHDGVADTSGAACNDKNVCAPGLVCVQSVCLTAAEAYRRTHRGADASRPPSDTGPADLAPDDGGPTDAHTQRDTRPPADASDGGPRPDAVVPPTDSGPDGSGADSGDVAQATDRGPDCVPTGDTDPTCDGVDDDCDGEADEDYLPRGLECGEGACAARGATRCVGGVEVEQCQPGVPTVEECNERDDDCDGETDEVRPADPLLPTWDRWVRVCAGVFLMGSPGPECAQGCVCGDNPDECETLGCPELGCPGEEGGRDPDERQRLVRLRRSVLVQATEVTQAQFGQMSWQGQPVSNPADFCADQEGGCAEGPDSTRPVEQVTWYEALAWCNWRSEAEGLAPCYRLQGCEGRPGEGMICATAAPVLATVTECRGYRLPTEAEWEYLARAGSATALPTGDLVVTGPVREPIDPVLDPLGWYWANSPQGTQPVATRAPNAWGLFDLHGNVWEWCWDRFGPYPYEPGLDPEGPADGLDRVARGGSWSSYAAFCRSANRHHYRPDHVGNTVGFRVVRSLPAAEQP